MSVTRFQDVIIPGGQPAPVNPNEAAPAPLSPFETEHVVSHNELLRTSLAITDRLAAAVKGGEA